MTTEKPASVLVKYRTVLITVFPWSPRPGVMYWKFRHGKSHVVRNTFEKAQAEAKRICEETYLGTANVGGLNQSQKNAIRRMLEIDPQLAMVDEFLLWIQKRKPVKACREAVGEFIALKERNQSRSTQNVRTLRKNLSLLVTAFDARPLSSITVAELERLLAAKDGRANRTRKNLRASWVTFFRWCRESEFLPDEKTVAEKTGTPIISDSIPDTYTPDELETMLRAVKPTHVSWLAVAAFGGFRTDEIAPITGSTKSPLDWSDFKWDRDIIDVRPETAKTKRRRIVPILPALKAWLWPLRKDSGPVFAERVPNRRRSIKDDEAETVRLGKLIGGWKPNALRHSWISYRAAEVGLAQTAMEAGNSEAEAKRSYNDSKSKAESNKWFAIRRDLIPQEYPITPNIQLLPDFETLVESGNLLTGGT